MHCEKCIKMCLVHIMNATKHAQRPAELQKIGAIICSSGIISLSGSPVQKWIAVPIVVCTFWPLLLNQTAISWPRKQHKSVRKLLLFQWPGKCHWWGLDSNWKQQLLIVYELDENPCSQSTGCPAGLASQRRVRPPVSDINCSLSRNLLQ